MFSAVVVKMIPAPPFKNFDVIVKKSLHVAASGGVLRK